MLRSIPIWLIGLLLLGCGSGEPEFRTYQEMTVERGPVPTTAPMMPDMPASPPPASAAPAPASGGSSMGALPAGMNRPSTQLAWTTPEGWEEVPGDGLRLVTFRVPRAECAVTTFPGDVGGVEANLRRWWGQISSSAFGAESLAAVMSGAIPVTAGDGISGAVYDFEPALAPDASASTVAAILDLGGNTAFLKLTGDRAALQTHKPALLALAESVRRAP